MQATINHRMCHLLQTGHRLNPTLPSHFPLPSLLFQSCVCVFLLSCIFAALATLLGFSRDTIDCTLASPFNACFTRRSRSHAISLCTSFLCTPSAPTCPSPHTHLPYRITLVENPPVDPDGGLALPSGLFNPTLLKELNQLQFSASFAQTTNTTINNNNMNASTTTLPTTITSTDATSNQAAPTFSISDFLVPGLQTKVWDDWQGVDVLSDYS